MRLKGLLASNADADEDDTRVIKRALRRLGLFEAPTQGITGIPNGDLFRGIKAFQKRQGLTVDGAMAPSGPTEQRLNVALERQVADRSVPERGRTAPPIGRATPTPRRSNLSDVHGVGEAGTEKRGPLPKVGPRSRRGIPVINLSKNRIRTIREDKPAIFEIIDDSKETGENPNFGESHAFGREAVLEHDQIIETEAERQGVDPDLVRAIVYVENARGYYDTLDPRPSSVRPANINPTIWKGLGGITPENARDPEVNIRAGVTLIKRIADRISEPTPIKVAAIWHFAGQEQTSADQNGYAARVAYVRRTKFWEEKSAIKSRQRRGRLR